MMRAVTPILVCAGLWAAAVPYLGTALSLRLDVARSLEVIDHVVPGAVVLFAAIAGHGARRGGTAWLLTGAAVCLAGVWATVTHVPLVPELLDGTSPAGAALLHLAAGPPALAAGAWMLLARGPVVRPPAPE